jgi:hypothetical protein
LSPIPLFLYPFSLHCCPSLLTGNGGVVLVFALLSHKEHSAWRQRFLSPRSKGVLNSSSNRPGIVGLAVARRGSQLQLEAVTCNTHLQRFSAAWIPAAAGSCDLQHAPSSLPPQGCLLITAATNGGGGKWDGLSYAAFLKKTFKKKKPKERRKKKKKGKS